LLPASQSLSGFTRRKHARTWSLEVHKSLCKPFALLLPLLWGAGPMALMLWLDGMMMMMMQTVCSVVTTQCTLAS
jgi:hypothetical protein